MKSHGKNLGIVYSGLKQTELLRLNVLAKNQDFHKVTIDILEETSFLVEE